MSQGRLRFYGAMVFSYVAVMTLNLLGAIPENTSWGIANVIFCMTIIGVGVEIIIGSKK